MLGYIVVSVTSLIASCIDAAADSTRRRLYEGGDRKETLCSGVRET